MSRLGRGLLGAAALVAVITLLARVVGFGRWLVYSSTVSSLCVGNAYSVANQLPNVLYEVVAGGALTGAVVPLLAGPLSRAADGDQEAGGQADRIIAALLGWTLIVLVPAALLLIALAEPLARALVDETACPGGADLAAGFLRVFAPQVVLYGVGVVLTGVLTAKHRFIGPALGPLLSSLTVIGAYLAFAAVVGPGAAVRNDAAGLPAAGRAWLGWGTTVGVAMMTVPLLWPVLRSGTRLRVALRFPDGVATRAAKLAGAGMAALLAQQATVVAVLILQRDSGNASTLNVFQYAQAVYLLPYAVLVVPLATTAFPRLSRHAARGEHPEFARASSLTTRTVLTAALLGTAGLIAVAEPVAAFFGGLDRGQVSAMAPTVIAMAPGLVGFGLIAHVGRALYALEAGRTVATASVLGWLVVAACMLGLGTVLDGSAVAVGLGAATSIGMSVAGVALVLGLRHHAGPAATAGVGRALVATGLVCLLAAAAGHWVGARLVPVWPGLAGAVAAAAAAGSTCVLVAAAGLLVVARDELLTLTRRRKDSR